MYDLTTAIANRLIADPAERILIVYEDYRPVGIGSIVDMILSAGIGIDSVEDDSVRLDGQRGYSLKLTRIGGPLLASRFDLIVVPAGTKTNPWFQTMALRMDRNGRICELP